VLERRIAHVHTRHRHGVKARIDMVIAKEKIIADSRARTGGRQDSAACDTQLSSPLGNLLAGRAGGTL
jgi:hypothetical protein